MKGSLAEQVKATIYQYQLVSKITFSKRLQQGYLFACILFFTLELTSYLLHGALAIGCAFAIIQFLHFIIIRLTLRRVEASDARRWSWSFRLPWLGYIPTAYIELALFRKLHRHLLWLGLCLIALSYPWSSFSLLFAMLGWHIWLLLPYTFILYRLRTMRPDGVVKLAEDALSYYRR